MISLGRVFRPLIPMMRLTATSFTKSKVWSLSKNYPQQVIEGERLR